VLLCPFNLNAAEPETMQSRLIVMADMGNEPDEVQQMAHLLIYANRVDIEGLIACSGKYLHADRKDGRTKTHPELLHELVDAYAKVVENLKRHEDGWPPATDLRSVIRSGSAGYGIDDVKPGRSNEASELIKAAILKEDPRPLYIVCNAGANTLAQALVDLEQARTRAQMNVICQRLIVFENGAQDNSGAWIAGRYPTIAWHRSNHQTYSYGGPGAADGPYTWEPFPRSPEGQHEWAHKHVMNEHGALGAVFPIREVNGQVHFIEGGGTIPWMGLVNHGMTNPEKLHWGGWSGRFSRQRHPDVFSRHQEIRADEQTYDEFFMFEADSEQETWTDPMHDEVFQGRSVPVWRFRRAMFNDFRARMDWCVNPPEEANHNPIAAFGEDTGNRVILLKAKPGEALALDSSASSDPDGDNLQTSWWHYREAGTYDGELAIQHPNQAIATLNIPDDANDCEIHIILELIDDNQIVPMYDYRRIVISVER
jgi:hypothetical protein